MNNYLFVHIPKTGGTSIRAALNSINADSWIRDRSKIHHDTITELLLYNQISTNTKIFSVVRNPYTRIISYYYHFNKINNSLISFNTFIDVIYNKIFIPSTPFIMYDQTYFISINNQIVVDNIFRYENLDEVEIFISTKLDHLNKGNYVESSLNLLDKSTINKIQEIYYRDFKNFNYCLEPAIQKNGFYKIR
mgnify:CR=1 FL=1